MREQILVVAKEVAFAAGAFEGFASNAFRDVMGPETGRLCREALWHGQVPILIKERTPELEKDLTLLQIIPYVIVRRGNGDVLAYMRTPKGGEQRLHNKTSIGFGGHANPITQADAYAEGLLKHSHELFSNNFHEMLTLNARRELQEELKVTRAGEDERAYDYAHQPTLHGMLYDSTSEVSSVHLGIVLCITVDDELEFNPNEESQAAVTWRSVAELRKDENLESWSKLLLDSLDPASTAENSL